MKNPSGWKLLAFLLLFSCVPSFATQILKVTADGKRVLVTHPEDAPWAVNDKACIFRGRVQIACGQVTTSMKKGAVLSLYTANREIVSSDMVKRLFTVRDPAALNSLSLSEADPRVIKFYALTGGIDLSGHYFFPYVKFDALVSDHLSVAGRVEYLSVSGLNLRGFSTSFSINYYAVRWYEGLWALAGVGFYLFSANNGTFSETALSPSLLTTIGWRFRTGDFLMGAAIGAQYITSPSLTTVSVGFSSVQGIALVDAGFTF